ncbi:MAG: type II toxin-antitoxin system RelE/ParE family toxin [Reichenbachiella sp.]|uniref:type II toxin-antitoxin system RelE family toxin n=1 Tax=Reichenbachiella sp. TaxID=2184521 RepID=UPI00326688A6
MKVIFLKKFSKDLDKIKQPKDREAILSLIESVHNCSSFREIPNTKKLAGFKDAYRIRLGDLRIGVFVNEDAVDFARVAFRKDIYNLFP